MTTRTVAVRLGPRSVGPVVDGAGDAVATPPRPRSRPRRVTAAQARRNRRFAALALAAVLLMAATAALVSRGGDVMATPATVPAPVHVTVAPGETLWDVARRHAPPGQDPRAFIDALRRDNGLRSSAVPAWTVLRLPD